MILLMTIENESDRDLLSEVFYKHQRMFLYQAKRHIPNIEDAEDILQTAMLKVIRNIDNLRNLSEAQLVAYIIKAVRSCTADFLRKNSISPQLVELQEIEYTAISNDDIMEKLNQKELSIQLGLVLEQLSPRDKDVLIYKYIHGYPDAKIAKALDVKPESVRMILTRARRTMKSHLMEEKQNEVQYQGAEQRI